MGDWRWADDPQPEQPDPLGRALRASSQPRLEHESVLFSIDTIDVPTHDRAGDEVCFRSYCLRPADDPEGTGRAHLTHHGRRVWRSRVFATRVPTSAAAQAEALGADPDAETVFRDLIEQVERELHANDS